MQGESKKSEKERLSRYRSLLKALPGKILLFDDDLNIIEEIDGLQCEDIRFSGEDDLTKSISLEFRNKFTKAISELEARGDAKYFKDGRPSEQIEYFDYQQVVSEDLNESQTLSCSVSHSDLGFWVLQIQLNSKKDIRDEIIKKQQSQIVNISLMSSLGEMAAGVAHEVNNPLHIIMGMAGKIKKSSILENTDKDKVTKYAVKIEQTVKRISKIVTGLSQLARKETSESNEEFNLNMFFDEVLDINSEKLHSSGVVIRNNITSDFKIYGRKVQLYQVFINLFNNAFDAVSGMDAPWIEVTAERLNSMVKISIKDCGDGIPEHIVNKIFDPFYTTKDIGKGTGLGLSISKQIVDAHGGQIGYELSDGHTCLYFEIPDKRDS